MPFTDSDLRALQPQAKKYRVSAGESLFIEVYPNGGRYFVWRHRFPPGKEGKLRDYQIGVPMARVQNCPIKATHPTASLSAVGCR